MIAEALLSEVFKIPSAWERIQGLCPGWLTHRSSCRIGNVCRIIKRLKDTKWMRSKATRFFGSILNLCFPLLLYHLCLHPTANSLQSSSEGVINSWCNSRLFITCISWHFWMKAIVFESLEHDYLFSSKKDARVRDWFCTFLPKNCHRHSIEWSVKMMHSLEGDFFL